MSMWRTEDPKFAQYAPDGQGRDTFISHWNGGFLKSNCNKIFPITGVHIAEHKHNHAYRAPQRYDKNHSHF